MLDLEGNAVFHCMHASYLFRTNKKAPQTHQTAGSSSAIAACRIVLNKLLLALFRLIRKERTMSTAIIPEPSTILPLPPSSTHPKPRGILKNAPPHGLVTSGNGTPGQAQYVSSYPS